MNLEDKIESLISTYLMSGDTETFLTNLKMLGVTPEEVKGLAIYGDSKIGAKIAALLEAQAKGAYQPEMTDLQNYVRSTAITFDAHGSEGSVVSTDFAKKNKDQNDNEPQKVVGSTINNIKVDQKVPEPAVSNPSTQDLVANLMKVTNDINSKFDGLTKQIEEIKTVNKGKNFSENDTPVVITENISATPVAPNAVVVEKKVTAEQVPAEDVKPTEGVIIEGANPAAVQDDVKTPITAEEIQDVVVEDALAGVDDNPDRFNKAVEYYSEKYGKSMASKYSILFSQIDGNSPAFKAGKELANEESGLDKKELDDKAKEAGFKEGAETTNFKFGYNCVDKKAPNIGSGESKIDEKRENFSEIAFSDLEPGKVYDIQDEDKVITTKVLDTDKDNNTIKAEIIKDSSDESKSGSEAVIALDGHEKITESSEQFSEGNDMKYVKSFSEENTVAKTEDEKVQEKATETPTVDDVAKAVTTDAEAGLVPGTEAFSQACEYYASEYGTNFSQVYRTMFNNLFDFSEDEEYYYSDEDDDSEKNYCGDTEEDFGIGSVLGKVKGGAGKAVGLVKRHPVKTAAAAAAIAGTAYGAKKIHDKRKAQAALAAPQAAFSDECEGNEDEEFGIGSAFGKVKSGLGTAAKFAGKHKKAIGIGAAATAATVGAGIAAKKIHDKRKAQAALAAPQAAFSDDENEEYFSYDEIAEVAFSDLESGLQSGTETFSEALDYYANEYGEEFSEVYAAMFSEAEKDQKIEKLTETVEKLTEAVKSDNKDEAKADEKVEEKKEEVVDAKAGDEPAKVEDKPAEDKAEKEFGEAADKSKAWYDGYNTASNDDSVNENNKVERAKEVATKLGYKEGSEEYTDFIAGFGDGVPKVKPAEGEKKVESKVESFSEKMKAFDTVSFSRPNGEAVNRYEYLRDTYLKNDF